MKYKTFTKSRRIKSIKGKIRWTCKKTAGKDGSATNFWNLLSFKILAKVANINLQYHNCSAMSQLFCNIITNS